ncbi:MAG: hypothetical protein JWM88_2489 [Verrucomicrobia bacterium]|nr:hypothetical protein [Verrucomicrobiota bacterium]
MKPENAEWTVALTFSGGGTRAAALAYGVLQELSRTRIDHHGRAERMLDHVQAISGVSGGSFTAAYYALHGDRLFADYENIFLKRDVQGALMRKFASPQNWFPLATKRIGRSDLAGEFYDHEIFGGATFGDLAHEAGRPRLLVNATDMVTGMPFAFTQQNFDLIGSNLGEITIGRAVAASSAAPVVLSPVTLRNHAAADGAARSAFAQRLSVDLDALHVSRQLASAVRSYFDTERRPFIHLVDGGVSDNLGLHGLLDLNVATRGLDAALHDCNLSQVRNIAVIVVNASAEHAVRSNTRSHPGVTDVLRAVSEGFVHTNTARALADFRSELEQWREGGVGRSSHLIEINFDQLTHPEERNFFSSLPTSFSLPPESVDRLRDVGARLLRQSGTFQTFLREFNPADAERFADVNRMLVPSAA